MADVKISALPPATTPLAGTEVLPIVQSSTTKKVSITDVTAGRAISASGVTVSGLTASKPVFTDGSKALTSSGTLATDQGGTGLTSYSQGDLVYYNTGTTLTALPKNTSATRYLANTGTSNNPAWAQVNLSNGVTGTLPTGNGGTGLTSFTANGVLYASSTSALATSSVLTFDGTNFSLSTASGNPSYVLKTAGSGNNPLYRIQADTNFWDMIGIFSNADDPFRIRYNNTDYLSITNTGGVSIGTTDPGAGNLGISNGNLVIGTSGKGIDFSVTSHPAGMTSELLADYEEGTFTPTYFGANSAGTTTYTLQQGNYRKIGNQVTVQIYLDITAATGTGLIRIGGLPFTTANPFNGSSPVWVDGYNWSAGTYLIGYQSSATAFIQIYACADDGAITGQNVTNETQQWIITATYFV